jgi:hypothetical protein
MAGCNRLKNNSRRGGMKMAQTKTKTICKIPSRMKGGWKIQDAKIIKGSVKATYVKPKK